MKTVLAVVALCLSSVAVAGKPLGTAAGAKSAILKAYPGLQANEISVKRQGMALANGLKTSDVFSGTVKQQVFLPGMNSLAAGTKLNAIAEKVGTTTEYKVTTGQIDF